MAAIISIESLSALPEEMNDNGKYFPERNSVDGTMVAEEHVLEMISQISESQTDLPSGNESRGPPNCEPSQTDTSCAKSLAITETSPEPEANSRPGSHTFQDEDEEDIYYEQKYGKLKSRQWFYITLAIALAVAFLGTLAGLIAVVTIKPAPSTDQAATTPTLAEAAKVTSYPVKAHEFPHVDGNDQEIARAFADYSLYESFYGVTYDGIGGPASSLANIEVRRAEPAQTKEVEESWIQRKVSLDVALLSRVTSRLRLVHNHEFLIDRVIQALKDLNINMKLKLSVNAADWNTVRDDIFRILNSYPEDTIESIYVETTGLSSPASVARIFSDLSDLFAFRKSHHTKVVRVDAQSQQANPLELGMNPKAAIEWLNTDKVHNVYTNLETPSETSDKAGYMTSWVCNVVPSLRPEVEWFWANAFDDVSRGVSNGLFTEMREMKPAGLPRCAAGK